MCVRLHVCVNKQTCTWACVMFDPNYYQSTSSWIYTALKHVIEPAGGAGV